MTTLEVGVLLACFVLILAVDGWACAHARRTRVNARRLSALRNDNDWGWPDV